MDNQGGSLGALIRLVRQKNGWTLRQLSEKTKIPQSTLTKVEADKLSLTYDKLQRLAFSLGLSMMEFLRQGTAPTAVTGRRSLTIDNSTTVSTPQYDYNYLCAELRHKRMVPVITRVLAHHLSEFGELHHHGGEEFIYMLEGTVEVHLEYYSSVILTVGQGMYLDSSMGHAYVTKDCESALLLAVWSGDDPDLARKINSLADEKAVRSA